MPSSAQLATLADWLDDAEDSDDIPRIQPLPELTSAEIGALAHLYRSEVYRCSVWRTRLDTTTNWAVVTLGVALSRDPCGRRPVSLWYSSGWGLF